MMKSTPLKLLKIESLLKDAVAQRIGSGIAAGYGTLSDFSRLSPGSEIYVGRTSHLATAGSVTAETFFDLASLTKILATTTLAMKRFDHGQLNLDAPISNSPAFQKIKMKHLLTHASGLPAWKPFYDEMRAHFGDALYRVPLAERNQKFREIFESVPPEKDPGQKIVYSDLGFLWLEKLLSNYFQHEVKQLWTAMGIRGLHFREVLRSSQAERWNTEQTKESIAATENCPWRGLLVGQVQDDNAWSKGGIAGHTGAFGRLKDLLAWIEAVFLGKVITRSTVKQFTQEAIEISGTRRALGFDMPSLDGSGSTGFWFSKETVGHLGFTGTSLWVDLVSGHYAVLLTNRVHPSRLDTRIRGLRREFHRLVRE